jgi:hypothetical protein
MPSNATDEFRQLATRWAPFIGRQIRSVLMVREGDAWNLLFANVAFIPEVPPGFEPLNIQTSSIRVLRDETPIADAASAQVALNHVLDGPALDIDGVRVPLARGNPNPEFEFEILHPQRFAGQLRFPALIATWLNPSPTIAPDLKVLDQELYRHSSPYDGFADVALTLHLPHSLEELHRRRLVEVLLMPPSNQRTACLDNQSATNDDRACLHQATPARSFEWNLQKHKLQTRSPNIEHAWLYSSMAGTI